MPKKKRERFVPDEEARELARMFALRDVRRISRLREQGTVLSVEKWRIGQVDRPASKSLRAFRKASSISCGVASGFCWFCVLGSVGSLEQSRVDLLPGVLMLCGFCVAAVVLGALACMLGGETE